MDMSGEIEPVLAVFNPWPMPGRAKTGSGPEQPKGSCNLFAIFIQNRSPNSDPAGGFLLDIIHGAN